MIIKRGMLLTIPGLMGQEEGTELQKVDETGAL